MQFTDKLFFRSLIIGFSIIALSAQSFAAESGFEYPELSVVPRASDRIEVESAKDRELGWKAQTPFLIPATASFLAGASLLATGTKSSLDSFDATSKIAPYVGMGVGLAWWSLTFGVLDRQDIYGSAVSEVSKLPGKTQREQLTRERRAEEAIYQAGSLSRKLKWISFASNFLSSGFMAASAQNNTASKAIAVGSMLTAFYPLIFNHRWETTESIHRDYKKRIYAPVASATLLPNPSGNSYAPGISLALQF
jgi:hypothetical protein